MLRFVLIYFALLFTLCAEVKAAADNGVNDGPHPRASTDPGASTDWPTNTETSTSKIAEKIYEAIETNNQQWLRKILTQTPEMVDQPLRPYIKRDSISVPIVFATYRGRLEIVKILIEAGAQINLTDSHGDTALHEAVFRKHMDIVKLLLENGADINIHGGEGKTALLYAVEHNDPDLVKTLLKLTKNTLVSAPHQHDKQGDTVDISPLTLTSSEQQALHHAIRYDHPMALDALVEGDARFKQHVTYLLQQQREGKGNLPSYTEGRLVRALKLDLKLDEHRVRALKLDEHQKSEDHSKTAINRNLKSELTMGQLVDNIVYQALQTHIKETDVAMGDVHTSNQALANPDDVNNFIEPLQLKSRPQHVKHEFISPKSIYHGSGLFASLGGSVGAGLDIFLGFDLGLAGILSIAAGSGVGQCLLNGILTLRTRTPDSKVENASIWNCKMASWKSLYKIKVSRDEHELNDVFHVNVSSHTHQSFEAKHLLDPKVEKVLINYSIHSFQKITPFNDHQIHGFVTIRYDKKSKKNILTHYTTRNTGRRKKTRGPYTLWIQGTDGGNEAMQLDGTTQNLPSCSNLLTP